MNFVAQATAGMSRARSVPFRSQFRIGPKQPRALKDEEIAMVHFNSSPSRGGITVVDRQGSDTERLKEMLPTALHAHYDKLRVDTRFDRFALFAKSYGNGTTNDGMIVGFAKDEFYYILAAWDSNGHDIWEPNPGDARAPLVVWD